MTKHSYKNSNILVNKCSYENNKSIRTAYILMKVLDNNKRGNNYIDDGIHINLSRKRPVFKSLNGCINMLINIPGFSDKKYDNIKSFNSLVKFTKKNNLDIRTIVDLMFISCFPLGEVYLKKNKIQCSNLITGLKLYYLVKNKIINEKNPYINLLF